MESISIVPSTVLNSIYVNERKNCTGGSVVLDDRYTVYFMQITDTTNISIDRSLLNIPTNCSLQFKLVIWSDKANVLNFSGCSIEQIEVKRGESVFTIEYTTGSELYTVISDVLSGYNEVPLRATSYPGTMTQALATEAGLKFENQYQAQYFDIFNWIAPFSLNSSNNLYGPCDNVTSCSTYLYSIKPFMIRTLQIHWNSGWSDELPSGISIYGSNDAINWTPILSNAELINNGTRYNQDISLTSSNSFYTMFRFDFSKNSNFKYLPPISVLGYEGSLINNRYYKTLLPYINASSSGYDFSSNSSDMSSTSGSVYNLLSSNTDGYGMVRSDTSVNFEFIYTLPEAQKICGLYLRTSTSSDQSPTMLSILGSNDNSTWTEIAKLDSNALYKANVGQRQDYTYLFSATAAYQYYKIIIYSTYSTNYFGLSSLQLLTQEIVANNMYQTIIPVLSSNSQDGYVVSATNTDDGQYYQMFDGNIDTFCAGHFADGQWVVNIQLPQATAVNGVCLRARKSGSDYNQTPYAFTVQGSNDNDTWTVLDTEILGSSYWTYQGQLATFAFANSTPYTYYRLVCTASANGTYCGLSELGLTTNGAMPNVNWTEDVYVVPVMASDSQDGYIVSAKSYWGTHYPWKAFDRTASNSDDAWECGDDDISDSSGNCDNVWLQIQLPSAQVVNMLYIRERIQRETRDPRDFTLKGSNDGETWTTLLTQTDQSYTSKSWEFNNTTAYTYYRLNITKINADNTNACLGIMNLIHRIVHN